MPLGPPLYMMAEPLTVHDCAEHASRVRVGFDDDLDGQLAGSELLRDEVLCIPLSPVPAAIVAAQADAGLCRGNGGTAFVREARRGRHRRRLTGRLP